eukprot:CAMPEP_0171559752 /NCGR_PEP_ID=MMETSP0960-20121227/13074_1 /TAXON_ID=87120 /ORGANISM="Aurantiochytrium limacinum, Strain ATCCMYA-1381" /LENGTH=89 /DNA_ID=CAMNT_0012111393 /DNA_START=301 /DNA_END=567 /DNA_ORIENTATION=-
MFCMQVSRINVSAIIIKITDLFSIIDKFVSGHNYNALIRASKDCVRGCREAALVLPKDEANRRHTVLFSSKDLARTRFNDLLENNDEND